MSRQRICVYLAVTFLASAPAFAKNETLVERGKRMCAESGVPLEDCTILPPALRGAGPNANVAAVTPAPRPLGIDNPGPAAFGTGKYGWCEDCTSLLAAAPVTPWSDFGGRQFRSQRDEDEQRTASFDDTSPGGDPADGEGDGNDGGDDGDDGDESNGGDGDNGDGGGTNGGEICD
ncbi:MAG: hypothetical protein ACR2RF_13765 [Geminicoccaceae bacterium]